MEIHNIEPVFDKNSKVLILGSFPSVKSREEGFFYGHKQNRFWQVISKITRQQTPQNIIEKKELLLQNNIAVWDVISTCEIIGSSDSSIKNISVNDLDRVLNNSNVKAIFLNGKTADKYFKKYIKLQQKMEVITLPSTSPANAVFTIEKLVKSWKQILNYL